MSIVTLSQNLISSATLRHDFESLTGWTAQKGSMELDAVYHKTGAAGIKVTGASDYGRIQLDLGATVSNQWDFSSTVQFRIWFYVHTTTTGLLRLLLHDATGSKIASVYLARKAGWNQAVLLKSDFSLTGGFTWNDRIRYFRVEHGSSVGEQVTWDSFYADVVSQSALAFTFDDAALSTYTVAYQYMKNKKVPGTFYVWTSKVNSGANFVTSAQLLEMQASGWILGNHTRNHTNLEDATYAEALIAIENGRDDLLAFGITNPYHLAYPGGYYDSDAEQAAEDAGMLTGRGTSTAGDFNEDYLPWPRPYQLKKILMPTNTTTLETATEAIDTVIANKCLGILIFHGLFASNPSTYGWYIDRFYGLVDYIVSKNIPCVTVDDLYNLQSRSMTVDIYDVPAAASSSKCLICPCSPTAWMWCQKAFIESKKKEMLSSGKWIV